MKPAAFRHFAPTSITDALSLMGAHAPDARVLAGGQSLVPMMNFRLARPEILIDLNKLADLAYIRDAGDRLEIGAMTRERDIETSDLVRKTAPLLYQATTHIGHLPIRSRGTIGGSLANADPAAEYPATILALDAVLVAQSVRGTRQIPAAEFFDGVMTTTLASDEILTQIVVPKAPPRSGSAFVEISRRPGDYALAGVAAQVVLSGDSVFDIRLAACGIGPGPIRLSAAENIVRTGGTTTETLNAAARAASAAADPDGDVHASADYRRRLAAVVTKRALLQAIEEARKDT